MGQLKTVRPAGFAVLLSTAALVAACGYGPAATVGGGLTPYCVSGVAVGVSDPRAVAEMEAAARRELARAGRLGECGRDDDLVLELVALTSTSEALVATDAEVTSRGVRVVAEARAHVTTQGARRTSESFDLGTLRAAVTSSQGRTAVQEAMAGSQARAEASRRVGASLARRAMGQPATSEPRAEARAGP